MIQIDKQAVYKYHGYVSNTSLFVGRTPKANIGLEEYFEIRQFMYNTDVISLEIT